MKIFQKRSIRKNTYNKITVVDIDGDSMTFDSVKKVAEFLDVNISRVYAALNHETKVRGCVLSIGD